MTEEKRLEILEHYRLSTGLFTDEPAKKSFFSVFKNLSEKSLLEIEKNLKDD